MLHEPAPPVPIDAVRTQINVVEVFFDKPLTPGPLDPSNWHDQSPGKPLTANVAMASADRTTIGFPSVPVEAVQFTPPPFDVLGENGVPVQAFVMMFS